MRMFLGLAGIWTTAVFAGAQIQMVAYQESEPNNGLAQPQVISTEVDQNQGVVVWNALIMPQGDQDFYQITVASSGIYSLRVDSNRAPTLTIYNARGEVIGGTTSNGNPDVPNSRSPGLTLTLETGTYLVQVAYHLNIGVCRYALRIFPGILPPDIDPTEPNDSFESAYHLGSFSGGELITTTFGFLDYGGQDGDIYAFKVSTGASLLRVRTETYVDTVIEVHTPSGQVFTNDDAGWDPLNGGASEVMLPSASPGPYYVVVRGFGRWGGYYRLRISAELPAEITLQDRGALFRLRDLYGSPYRSMLNNADWIVEGIDHFYQISWWFRREGVDFEEQAFSQLYSFEQVSPREAILTYREDKLILGVRYHLSWEGSVSATLRMDVYVVNLSNNPQTVYLYHYFDPDIRGNSLNSAEWQGERLVVRAPQGDYCYLTPITPYNFWEVQPWPQTLDRLIDGEPTQLINGSVPFEGDVAGAFQWQIDLAPFAWQRITVHYALNTPSLPILADVNQDGCVDDADLLEVLFAFGTNRIGDTDVNGDGVVDDSDLLGVLFWFGAGC